MLKIVKISSCSAVDYAAEELRKYLRMMMPERGHIEIQYAPDAEDGFRLGLMQDFGLDVSDAEEAELDDILYIDTTTEGGIIAGDNPRSVLLAVYEYLRQNGCRWLFPGVDGEFIPMRDIRPVRYRHKPSMRYRGQCNEGYEYQSDMYDAIEFTPKVGMNVFMMEYFNPVAYYRRYYNHKNNECNRAPEPISDQQVLQWKRACEAEISKRGLMYHDIGHGWTAQPFGIDTTLWVDYTGENDAAVSDVQRQYLAMINGERKLFMGCPNFTQFCMSNPDARRIVADYVADYAENHANADYIHVWLADARNNHCECENCKKKIPSDWYVMLLNDIDDALTAKKLNTRIVYIAYTETIWAPETEHIRNPGRFSLLFAPSTRKYSSPMQKLPDPENILPYERNNNQTRKGMDELMWHFRDWTKNWHGANLTYEYHFWRHQVYDVGGISLAKIINEDIKFYKRNNIHGVIEDGSQRSFFPTGLAFYTYARTLCDVSLSFEEIAEEYFSCAFGEDWREFYDYLERLGKAFDHEYLSGDKYRGTGRSEWYAPEHVASIKTAYSIIEEGRRLISEHYNSDYRVRTVAVRLLEFHAKYAEMFADALVYKAAGDDENAVRYLEEMKAECGRYEIAFERWYDHGMFFEFISGLLKSKTVMKLSEIDMV